MKTTFSKKLSNLLIWTVKWIIAASLTSHIIMANASESESIKNHSNGSTQSVLKSTDDNEITIKLDNQSEQGSAIEKTVGSTQNKSSPQSSLQQAALFRIYRSSLLKKTYQHIIYPESAIDRNQQGDVILKLMINRDGKIQNVDYDKRADFSSLNKAAARAVENSSPYPKAPKNLSGESFEVIMPIKFRLAG